MNEMNDIEELALFGLAKLDLRFNTKIDPEEYYLSYSGGNDSHLLYWYIKYRNLPITIVALNTYREHIEIKDRMYNNADVVLTPTKSFEWINEHYGMPCFSKQQDEYIKRYQNGNRSENTMRAINGGEGSKFQLNQTAKRLVLSGELHKVSGECCKYTKKEPLRLWGKKNNKLPIIGIRRSESMTRKAKYQTCLNKKGTFSPLYDLPDQVVNAMYIYFKLDRVNIYNYVDRTGCIGCPYGKRNTELELSCVTPNQKQYAIDSFKKSYDVLGIEYINEQLNLF